MTPDYGYALETLERERMERQDFIRFLKLIKLTYAKERKQLASLEAAIARLKEEKNGV